MDSWSFLEKKLNPLPLDDFEIYHVDLRQFSAEAKEGEINFLEESTEQGWALRLFKDGRCGFACSSDGTQEALEKMVGLAHQSLALVGISMNFGIDDNKRK